MRETQIIGLNKEARTYIQNNCQESEVLCPHCKQGKIKEVLCTKYASAAHCGMFSDGPELYEYTLKDGKKLKEVVQAVPWSSGPCIFLCLELDGKQLCTWSEKEINEA
jgi:glutaredoxin